MPVISVMMLSLDNHLNPPNEIHLFCVDQMSYENCFVDEEND